MSEYLQVIWQGIKAGLGLGPRREMTPEARFMRAVEKNLDWRGKVDGPSLMSDIDTIIANVITRDWEVTPGYAQELARQLREALAAEGLTIRRST